MNEITGIHHVTAIAGDPQENLAFYTGVLGMRLVKRSVNQDQPGTYHLFYADATGTPGTDLTFFPQPGGAPGRPGIGLGAEIALAVPHGSLDFWEERFAREAVSVDGRDTRRGEEALRFGDPHGQRLALVATRDRRDSTPWSDSPVPGEHQVLGLHTVRCVERELGPSADFLTGVLGFREMGEADGWHRFGVGDGGSGRHIEIQERPDERRGSWGVGTMHHVAWRVADVDAELAVRDRVAAASRRPTDVIDRFWFKSVYFLEPGGVLFELATEGPGFTIDEDAESLGDRLVLPPWLEARRHEIEEELPPLTLPQRHG